MHGTAPIDFFSKEERAQIQNAIAAAEQNTSGEIRVHLVRSFKKGEDPLETGKRLFEKLGMTQTQARNGVLFLLELKHHHFIILGDQGIDQKVEEHFWEEIRDVVIRHFRQDNFAQGLAEGIRRCGEKLKIHFPYQTGDQNELSDEISHGD